MAAVAGAYVQEPIGTEGEAACPVEAERLAQVEEHALRGRVGDVRIGRADVVFGKDGVRGRLVHVGDEEAPVGGVAGMEGQSQQAVLAATADLGRDVKEGLRQDHAGTHDVDDAVLVKHEESVVTGVGHQHRPGHVGDDRGQGEVEVGLTAPARGRCAA